MSFDTFHYCQLERTVPETDLNLYDVLGLRWTR